MPPGRPTKGTRHAMEIVSHLTALGAIDPQDAASLATVLHKLEMLLQGYRAAGDERKITVYVSHEHETPTKDNTRKE